MRKALIVGIDHYTHTPPLFGCVKDAHRVSTLLERDSDGRINFPQTKLLTATGPNSAISRSQLRTDVKALFEGDGIEVALFYFSGHGHIDGTGGFLAASDTMTGDDGLSLQEIVSLANKSKADQKIIILDSCHSGSAGANHQGHSELSKGLTIMTASTAEQYATEINGSGLFTSLLLDALNGGAANLLGEITPGSVYAHIDKSLGPHQQRPIFKTNVQSFVSLRRVTPPIALADLLRLKDLFPTPGFKYSLDPTYEPERCGSESVPPPNPLHTAIFSILQRYNRVNLLVPEDAPHMWHAAMNSKSCRLTGLGEHYRNLVVKGLI